MQRLNCIDCGVPVGVTNHNVPPRCKLCKTKLDRGPTVGEVLSDAQRFREEIELDAVLQD